MIIIECEDEYEADQAIRAIADLRIMAKCRCDFESGYTCKMCNNKGSRGEGKWQEFDERYRDIVYKNRVKKL